MKNIRNYNYTARIEDWVERHVAVGIYIIGHIYDDAKGRWEDGTLFITSAVCDENRVRKLLGHSKEGDVVRTLNSTYLLGRKYNVQDENKVQG